MKTRVPWGLGRVLKGRQQLLLIIVTKKQIITLGELLLAPPELAVQGHSLPIPSKAVALTLVSD